MNRSATIRSPAQSPERSARLVPLVLLGIFALAAARSAWLCDDAYITLRTIENLLHGRGLTYNPVERVQAYTHPLWLLVLTAVAALTRESYYTVVFLSLAISIAAVAVVAFRCAGSPMAGAVAIALLTSSKAFVEFSTSGLENALAALLLAGFLAVSSKDRLDARGVLALSLLAAGCVLNRMDAALLIAPSLAAAILSGSARRALPLFALGFLPFVAWLAFSTYYYGFPFPNTAYAKLGTGLPVSQLVPQGLRYALNSLAWDPITLITTAAGCAAGLASKRKCLAAVSAGILLHVAYVLWIGGDFMSGRLFTPSLVAGVALIASRVRFSPMAGAAAIGAALLLGFSNERSPLRQPTPNLSAKAQRKDIKEKNDGISDERAFYHERTGLTWALRGRVVPSGVGAQKGLEDRERAAGQGGFVRERGAIGMYGYFAGPNVHVLDVTGLADPLLARIPLDPERPWRIGHFIREVPAGYIESVASDENHVADPNLAEYYDRLRRLTRGPLDDRGRWGEIWRMNVGRYDGLMAAYVAGRAALDIPARVSENPRLSEEPDDDESPEGPDREKRPRPPRHTGRSPAEHPRHRDAP